MDTHEIRYCTSCAKKDPNVEGALIPDSGRQMVLLRGELENGTLVYACTHCDNPNLIKIATLNNGPPIE
jgi:hypothetical protein